MKKTILGFAAATMVLTAVVSCKKNTDVKTVKDVDTVIVETDSVMADTLVVDGN